MVVVGPWPVGNDGFVISLIRDCQPLLETLSKVIVVKEAYHIVKIFKK